MTYSIVAYDPQTQHFGAAVQTHQVGVGRFVLWMRPTLGVVVTQSLTNISFGPIGIAMLKERFAATHILNALIASDPEAHRRQVAVLDAKGNAAAFTGKGCIPEAGHHVGEHYSVQANMMTRNTVIPAMRDAYESAMGDLAARLLAALFAAQAQDGDIRGMQSAAIRIISSDPESHEWETLYDLRADEHPHPVEELARLVHIRRAKIQEGLGFQLFQQERYEEALSAWQEARAMAPDQEEMGFWQAIALADKRPFDHAVSLAAQIIMESVRPDDRYTHWLELIRRLETCGLLERPGAADELLKAIHALE